jgi:hypothetical protein
MIKLLLTASLSVSLIGTQKPYLVNVATMADVRIAKVTELIKGKKKSRGWRS